VTPDATVGAVGAAASTDSPPDPPLDPVDWSFAERVAHRIAGGDPLAESYHRASLESDFAEVTARSADLVAAFTGLQPDLDAAEGLVLDRQAWVSANLASFRHLLRPLVGRLGERLTPGPAATVGRRVAGAETGLLVGWFAQRVLGQYDLFGGASGDGAGDGLPLAPGGRVYYVAPNVLGLERRYGFRSRDFRMWIALHEVTHLVQFTGIPWLRPYFLGLVEESLSLVDPDPKRIVRLVQQVVEDLRAGRNPLADGGLVNLLATGEQREVLARVQSLMSLLEGHGNFVMDRLGARHVEGQERMSRVLRERRKPRGVGGQIQQALGIELKLRQYAVGEEFFVAVEREAGVDILAALWESPDQLPTLDELREPGTWVARVRRAA